MAIFSDPKALGQRWMAVQRERNRLHTRLVSKLSPEERRNDPEIQAYYLEYGLVYNALRKGMKAFFKSHLDDLLAEAAAHFGLPNSGEAWEFFQQIYIDNDD